MRFIRNLGRRVKRVHFSAIASLSLVFVLQSCMCNQLIAQYYGSPDYQTYCPAFKLTSLYFTTIPNGPAVVTWSGPGGNPSLADSGTLFLELKGVDGAGKPLETIGGKPQETIGEGTGEVNKHQATIPILDGSLVQSVINAGGTFVVDAEITYQFDDNPSPFQCQSELKLPGHALLPTPIPTATLPPPPPQQLSNPPHTNPGPTCHYPADCDKKGCNNC